MQWRRQSPLIRCLMQQFGRTYASEAGIRLEKNTPAPLFQLLYAALLLCKPIPAANAVRATRALIAAGLTTPAKMAKSSWQERVDVITWHGYKRYDERTSTMLGDMAERLLNDFDGDLRILRRCADYKPSKERQLLQTFKGIGPVGADIFLREVQLVWSEAYPYADDRVLAAAAKLGLGKSVKTLAACVPQKDFARLASALIRVDLAHAYDEIFALAQSH